ncbi:putative metallopeptidase DUF4344 [Mycobacterium sp. BK086]|uniref:DUF4344 domain-containing metallopeptidase n=1 Tax=Mycobacterium sp. BK086 TaxID=2512165 RepID=UPI00105C1A96|nr:DUF4344 domain-containing metallopeptidase [Mycobacterium sp. BK086]TDO14826.1 putative metallopeptidase DUF4344 [Mycobacterium sp. BK086]
MARSGAVVVAVSLLVVGCSSKPSAAPSPSTTAETPAATASPVVATQTNGYPVPKAKTGEGGKMVVTYDDATTPEAIAGRDLMEKTHFVDGIAQSVSDWYVLPYDVSVRGAECGEANDYWSSGDKTLTLCYEDVDQSLKIFAKDPKPEETARRIAIGAFFHEVGHMAIDIYDLPVTGREEDVADQLAAYELLAPYADGHVDPDFVQAAKDTAREYSVLSKEGGPLEQEAFADVHTLDQARAYNFDCWVYGSDPEANADIVSSGLLPQDRADGCQAEWDQLVKGWTALLEPHMR